MAREIVLTGQISGTRNGKNWPVPGTRLSLSDDEANSLVNSGMAIEADDDRVQHIGNGNGGEAFSDALMAGAPTGRDWTEGQADTNLSRARALAMTGDPRGTARAAAERAGLTDADTIPGANPADPTVGDDKPNPTDAPSLVALPKTVEPGNGDDDVTNLGPASTGRDVSDKETTIGEAQDQAKRNAEDKADGKDVGPVESASIDNRPSASNKPKPVVPPKTNS